MPLTPFYSSIFNNQYGPNSRLFSVHISPSLVQIIGHILYFCCTTVHLNFGVDKLYDQNVNLLKITESNKYVISIIRNVIINDF
jgi:hypothetical protein